MIEFELLQDAGVLIVAPKQALTVEDFQAISRTGETVDAGSLYRDARDAPSKEPRRQDTAALR